MQIKYLSGDATLPILKPAVIAHICNNVGGWGAGFVVAVTKRFGKGPELSYRLWSNTKECVLGEIQFVTVSNDIMVCNMVAQNGLISKVNPKPIDYLALKNCLRTLFKSIKGTNTTVHMPRIGCGLAGSTWAEIEPIIQKTMTVDTYVYDFDPTPNYHIGPSIIV